MTKDSLNYIKNNEEVTWFDFIDKWAPVGNLLFTSLKKDGLIEQDVNGLISLTEEGEQKLKKLNNDKAKE